MIPEERQETYSALMSDLIRKTNFFSGSLIHNIRQITETAGRLMKTERTSVWTYKGDHSQIECLDAYDMRENTHLSGEVLELSNSSHYTLDHKDGSVIAAEDVYADIRTSSVSGHYFQKHDIRSALDAPVFVQGHLRALLSFETVGHARCWLPEDEQTALAFAAYVAGCLEAEERIRSEAKYRVLFEGSNDGIFVLCDSTIVEANDQALSMFGLPREALLNMPWHPGELSPKQQPDGSASYEKAEYYIQKALGGIPQRFEWVHQKNDGTTFYADVSLAPVTYGDKRSVMAAFRDISAIKRSEYAIRQIDADLRESERKFSGAFGISPLPFVIADFESARIDEVNEAFCAVSGFSRDEVIGRTSAELNLWADDLQREQLRQRTLREGQVKGYEALIRTKSGEFLTVEMTTTILHYGVKKGFLIIIQDITPLKKAEAKLRTIIEESPFAIVVTDVATGQFLDVNKRYTEMFGRSREDLVGKSTYFLQQIPEEKRRYLKSLFDQYGRLDNEELEIHAESGRKFHVSISTHVVTLDGRLATITAMQDITAQKLAEKARAATEEKFAALFEASPDFVAVSNLETGQYYETNAGLRHLFGYSREELVGRTVFDLGIWKNIEDREAYVAQIREKGVFHSFATKLCGKSGNTFDVTISSRRIKYDGKDCMLSVVRDMTEHVKLEEQLRQSQKLEAIGKLAGGVAHDFNNVLTGIIGHAHIAKTKMPPDSPCLINMEQILSLAAKAGSLSHSLLAFSRKQVLNIKPVSTEDIIQRSEKLLRRLVSEDISLSIKCNAPANINADSLQIEQVVMNLVVNARDAMPNGGSIAVVADVTTVDDLLAKRHSFERGGRFACITVSDTGVGMSKDTMKQIFEPFFTTKEVGKGTGLGLSMAYGIVKQHHGFISVYSEPGIGSEFRIYLPLVRSEVVRETAEAISEPVRGTETVLLAEDSEDVRILNSTILSDYGYTVIEACDGEEAIALFKENADRISLAVLDVIMPKKNGKEVCDAIRSLKPDMKIMFLSGYTEDYIRSRADLGSEVCLVYKPIEPLKLLTTVRNLLDFNECKI